MSNENQHILTQANAAISRGDYEGFLSFCTADTIWNFVGDEVLEGKDAVRQYFTKTYKTPPQFKVQRLIADGDNVVAMGDISLEDESGKNTTYNYCDVWTLKDGKLHELYAYVVPLAQKDEETVTGSGFSYDEQLYRTDKSIPLRNADHDDIVPPHDLGRPDLP